MQGGGGHHLRPRAGAPGAAQPFTPPPPAFFAPNPYFQNLATFQNPGLYLQNANSYLQHPPPFPTFSSNHAFAASQPPVPPGVALPTFSSDHARFAAPEPPAPPGVSFPTFSSNHACFTAPEPPAPSGVSFSTFSSNQAPFAAPEPPARPTPSHTPGELREKVERAVAKAHRDLLAAGEGVSAWKVCQSALMALQIDSWSSLGFPMQDVPSLYRLMVTEGKINAYIHCYVGVRRITSIYDLNAAICKNEGIGQFEELGLGPLLRHPLLGHYFSIPSDETEIFKITTEEIICALSEFLGPSVVKKVQAEDFLDFLTKKLSATREKLGIRLQSFGFHISCIRAAKRTERMALDNYTRSVKQSSAERAKENMKILSQAPEILSEKQALDKRFNSISDRVKQFSSINECSGNKHIRFVSSGSEENGIEDDIEDLESDEHNSNDHCQSISQNMKETDHRVNNCPYPSQSEEMLRLRFKVGIDGARNLANGKSDVSKKSITKKRKFEDLNSSLKDSCKLPISDKSVIGDLLVGANNKKRLSTNHKSGITSLREEVGDLQNKRFVIDRNSMKTFVAKWAPACKDHSIIEVLDMMMNFYSLKPRKRRKMLTVFSSYPAVGLLNLALMSMKSGMWSDYSNTLEASDNSRSNSRTSDHSEMIENALAILNVPASGIGYSTSAGDIIEKVKTYLNLDHIVTGEGKSSLKKHFVYFKKFHECEIWLSKQFSVKDFSCLGHGQYLEFLEKHISMIPFTLLEGVVDGQCENLLEVSMSQKQLQVLLSQAVLDAGESFDFDSEQISSLLRRQFPMISLKLMGNSSKENLSKLTRKHVDTSSSVLFSAILLSDACKGESLVVPERGLKENFESERNGCLGSMSSSDALNCLLEAPMLSDLHSWSHWDLIYAPSLGPLLEWLLAEVRTEHLACILTKDGKLIRIDPSVTVDSVLEALLKGSSHQTAVNLLSLLSLYRGTNNVPVSLLKCYAVQAMDVIIKNYMDTTGMKNGGKNFMQKTILDMDRMFKSECPENLCLLNEALASASKFILDCLSQIPFEFRSYAANILLYALKSFTKDAPGIMLRECSKNDQLLMLHDIGLSLGVQEWIENYCMFGSGTAASSSLITESNKACGSPLVIIQSMPSPVQHAITDSKMVSHEEGTTFLDVNGTCGECKKNEMKEVSIEKSHDSFDKILSENNQEIDAIHIIELIRKEEFGLDSNFDPSESCLLKKQHARLGRALHCLSQELYSQDSHLILELVQNADDNIYPENVEPTLIFILQATGVVVLNNEWGFSAQNIRALCDVGNSTKKGSGTGFIGQKGIGFKSVFRVTDAPEIHSNGFHVKFDISEGQIGFVLPTVISACDVNSFTSCMSSKANQINPNGWNTCIVLPFRSKIRGAGIGSVVSMFSDLHPSLLLFLHRLQCIMFKNMMNDSLIIMRKEMVGNGIIKVSDGSKSMNWLVSRKKLRADVIRPDVLTTEIAVAFTLQESDNGVYQPHLEQQPVFAFLPLRTYGLKFILQGDFVLPSSREEVDGDSAWNQWLLSEFPSLFTDAENSFCELPCFKNNPGRAVTAYMSFVPLVGEVHGFFSHLPRMIISKLRVLNCLLLEGRDMEWVPPCRVLRGWDDQARNLLSEGLLHQHLGLGYLNKDILLSDSLAKALGVQDYGPKILIEIISSVCAKDNGIQSLGLDWLSSWLIALATALSVNSSTQVCEVEYDLFSRLKKISFIPLSDGSYGSLVDGPIWIPCDSSGNKSEGEHDPKHFTYLHANLRTVNSLLFAGTENTHTVEESHVAVIVRMLVKIGVQQLSEHEIINSHILPAMSSNLITADIDKHLMTDYLSFVVFHVQSFCPRCQVEKAGMISELQRKAIVLTNSGFKRPSEDSIHFSKAFGNFIDVEKLISANILQWHEIDAIYLNHPITRSLPSGYKKWRDFFEVLGVTDFVRVVHLEKKSMNLSSTDSANAMCEGGDLIFSEMVLEDWESPELVHLLSNLSLNKCRDSCMYLVEILDKMWDDNFSAKATSECTLKLTDEKRLSESSFVKSLRNFRWISSSADGELHYPKDLFYKSDAVYSILGDIAPYAVPQVRSQLFLTAVGLKTQVTLNDALALFQKWRTPGVLIRASIAQMSRFYTFVWNEIRSSEREIKEFRSGPSIFLPSVYGLTHDDIVCGQFLSADEVYWHDPTGCIERTKELVLQNSVTESFLNQALAHLYPGLCDFFVNECGVHKNPPSCSYLQMLLNLAKVALPSQAANAVFHVLLKWADDIKCGLLRPEEISYLKQCLLKVENTALPTVQDRWVSLHSSFGLVCWSDDEDLRKEFKHSMSIDFLHFGEHNDVEKQMLSEKMSSLMQALGIPALSEVVSREAIFYGMEDCTEKTSLVNWILPYAQRYIYVLHPSRYSYLKKFEYERLHQLQVAVVEKLYYRHTIKGCESISNKRFECNCLLQGNTLYVTKTSDAHSIFMELSRFFFEGSVELHFANFLHMVTTMAESGSTEEQTEFFIVNSQKVQKLPESESTWNLSCLSPACEDSRHFDNALPIATENSLKQKPKVGIVSNWPPTNWKTAPDFRFARQNHYRRAPVGPPSGALLQGYAHNTESDVSTEDWQVDDDWVTADHQEAAKHLPLHNLRTTNEAVVHNPASSIDRRLLSDPKSFNIAFTMGSSLDSGLCPPHFTSRDQLLVGLPTESQAIKIGRLGELVAYKYFVEKMGSAAVKWVNEQTETGLPFDLVIGDNEENKEYIEVKATSSMTKDWFTISIREWQFAVERGNSFSVAHIVLGDSKRAKVTILKNPVKLCQQNGLQLVILMKKQQ